MREEVRWFAEKMEERLAAHDRQKGTKGWDNCTVDRLFGMMIEEAGELFRTIDEDRPGTMLWVIDEAADVANFAMMIADKYRMKP